jgi:tetratricopeptide (TPR) repeat protein
MGNRARALRIVMTNVGSRNRWVISGVLGALILGVTTFVNLRWKKADRTAELIEHGQVAYNRQDWSAAEAIARERLKIDRQDPAALRLLGRALYHQQRDQAAAGIYERLGSDAMTAEDYLLVGQSCVRAEKVDLAMKVWQKALQLEPNHFESRMALEQTYFRLDRLSDAATEVQNLLEQGGHTALAELMKGQIRAQQNDPAGAALAFQNALANVGEWQSMVDPIMVRKSAARSLLQMGRPVLAREQLDQITSNDRDTESGWLLARSNLQRVLPSDESVLTQSRAYRESHPLEPEPSPYVGEARCAQCHADIGSAHHKSRHSSTFYRANELPPVPIPDRQLADPGNDKVSHAFHKRGNALEVETNVNGAIQQTIIDYAFGSGDRGLTLVGHNQEGRFLEYRLSHYPERVGWDITSGQPPQPDNIEFQYQGKFVSRDDLRHCMECHNTSPHAIVTGSGAEAADRAIGCERCHGPGGNHVQLMASKDFAQTSDVDMAIARPSLASGPAIVGLCAVCHSAQKKGLRFERGSPRAVRFQGTTLTWSRCYSESDGKLDCLTCHNPHTNAETGPRSYESKCLQCHSSSPATTADRSRRSHAEPELGQQRSCPVQPASGCIDCHMPRRDALIANTLFTDHYIRVPTEPELQSDQHQ